MMSGYLPAAKKFKITPGLESTPILHCHGTQDALVNFALAKKSADSVMEMGIKDYTIKTYPIGHTVDLNELQDVLKFLKKVLPKDDTCKIKVKPANEMSIKELKAAIRKAGLSSKAIGLMEKSEFVRLLQDHRDGKL
jgi:hypothetical protein